MLSRGSSQYAGAGCPVANAIAYHEAYGLGWKTWTSYDDAIRAVGGIVISPEAYEPSEIRLRSSNGTADFQDSELDLASLALDIAIDGVDIRC